MRQKRNLKLQFFFTAVPDIQIPNGRDAIYCLLRGIQEIYDHSDTITELILNDLSEQGKRKVWLGARGMTAWQVFILAVLRLNLVKTFDELEFDFNHNQFIRQFLELNHGDEVTLFSSRTLNHNYDRLKATTLNEINDIIVKKSIEEGFEDGKVVRGDSFVCDSNGHFPTDQSLIADGCRKVIQIFSPFSGWRQYKHLLKKSRRLAQNVSKSKRGRNSDTRSLEAYRKLFKFTKRIISKSLETLEQMNLDAPERRVLVYFLSGLEYVRDVAEPRILNGEKIEHTEKVFSLFEPHVEMINRGKFPQPFQLGHRVILTQGESGMVLTCKVMDTGSQDVDELLPTLQELYKKYGKLKVASFDKGYWSPVNKETSSQYVEKLVIARKGKGTEESKQEERETEFVRYRVWRSGVEALISVCVRSNGLDRCRDKGKDSFDTWVHAAIITRNLIQLGKLCLEREKNKSERRRA